jgi:hypothetical protein
VFKVQRIQLESPLRPFVLLAVLSLALLLLLAP